MAAAASASFSYSTKAKPRGRPLSRSIGKNTSRTAPTCVNRSWTSVRVVLKSRFPTNTLAAIHPSLSAHCVADSLTGQREDSQAPRPVFAVFRSIRRALGVGRWAFGVLRASGNTPQEPNAQRLTPDAILPDQ